MGVTQNKEVGACFLVSSPPHIKERGMSKRLYLVTVEFEGFVWADSRNAAEDLADTVVDEWNNADVTSRKVSRKSIPKDYLDIEPTCKSGDHFGTINQCLERQEAEEAEEARLKRERDEWERHPRLDLIEEAAA